MFDLYNGGAGKYYRYVYLYFFLRVGKRGVEPRHWTGVNNETIEENGFNRQ